MTRCPANAGFSSFPDVLRATLTVTIDAEISIEPDDREDAAATQSEQELDVTATVLLRRHGTIDDEAVVMVDDVTL